MADAKIDTDHVAHPGLEPVNSCDKPTDVDVRPDFQPPEILRNMSPEERDDLEKKLLRKIDLRLLPMIVLMYILNYIDR